MGFLADAAQVNCLFQYWLRDARIFAPKVFPGGGRFSDTDCIRYGEIKSIEEAELERKSLYSFKEALQPVSETLFYFTENEVREADAPKKGAILFLRSCDLHALRRLDAMYLHNGNEDYYYSRLRSHVKIVLIGCPHSFENCFCVSMGTNRSENYDMSIDVFGGQYRLDVKDPDWARVLRDEGCLEQSVVPSFVTENGVKVQIPENLSAAVAKSHMWDEYDSRCINCGRCNFVCPTCTCFTMQDLYYSENGKAGERRRVWASCMVDGYTDVAGGGSYRKKNGERMRFKTLHKVLDFRERNGFNMCVGCGRCDDVCPEYISFSHILNKLDGAMKEVQEHAGK
jgi:anaerobic sulfite reductase subunit A